MVDSWWEEAMRDLLLEVNRRFTKRLSEELWKFAEALNDVLYDVFQNPSPDWNTRLDAFRSEQKAAGFNISPASWEQLVAFIDHWHASLPAGESAASLSLPHQVVAASSNQPPTIVASAALAAEKHQRWFLNNEELFFLDKLSEATRHVQQIEPVLRAASAKVTSARPGVDIDLTSELDVIDRAIYLHNDALETARGTFLSGRVRNGLFSHLDQTALPTSLGLPLYADQGQARRAQTQFAALDKMFASQVKTLDRTIYWLQKIETAGEVSSWALGGGVLVSASKQGAKVLVRTAIKSAIGAAGTIAIGSVTEHALSALGFEEETSKQLGNAAQLISQLLLWRKIHTGNKISLAKTAEPASLPGLIASTGGKLMSFRQQQDQYYYRVFSGNNTVGSWLTATRPKSAAWAREALSLPPGNKARFIQRVLVPAGTRLQRSRALPVIKWRRDHGGGEQFQLLEQIPKENFGPGVRFR